MEEASGVKMITGLKGDYKKGKSLLASAMKDERGAPIMYSKLIKTLPKSKKKVVRGIIRDERRHLKLLKKIKGGIY